MNTKYQFFPTNELAHMKRRQAVSEPPNRPPLSRSYTDSKIKYPCLESPEIPGSAKFITKDGFINLRVLLKVSLVSNPSHAWDSYE